MESVFCAGIRGDISGTDLFMINDEMLLDQQLSAREEDAFIPISLKQGWFKLKIDLGPPFLKIVLGGEQVPEFLAGDILAH